MYKPYKLFLLLTTIYTGICLGAAHEVQDTVQSDHIAITCGNAIPGGDFTLKIRLNDIEQLTGKSYGKLHQKACKKGLPLALISVLWFHCSDYSLSRETLDLCSFLRSYGSTDAEAFVDEAATQEMINSTVSNYIEMHKGTIVITKKSIVQSDGTTAMIEVTGSDKRLIQGFHFFVGPDCQRMYDICNGSITFSDENGIEQHRLANQNTSALVLKAALAADAVAHRALAFLYAIHAGKEETIKIYPAITEHALFLLNRYIKKYPEDIAVKNWLEAVQNYSSKVEL